MFSLLGSAYSDCSASAFALFKLVQSAGAAAAFYYSGALSLYYQLLILVVSGVVGTVTFVKVELESGVAAVQLGTEETAAVEQVIVPNEEEEGGAGDLERERREASPLLS